jgi:hypothetical protein
MPKIRIEYEVPEDDCRECELRVDNLYRESKCLIFDFTALERDKDGSLHRCQPCIDAEVKEGE